MYRPRRIQPLANSFSNKILLQNSHGPFVANYLVSDSWENRKLVKSLELHWKFQTI